MAAAIFKTFFSWRSFSVFARSPVVCASRKSQAAKSEEPKLKEPKMPPKPFILYLTENIAKVNQNHTPKESVKIISDAWNKLPESEKLKYGTLYGELYEEYIMNWFKFFKQKKSEEGSDDAVPMKRNILKVLRKKMGKPSQPSPGFLKFAIENAKNSGKTLVIPDYIIEGKEKWARLPESERNRYIAEARIEREEYDKALLEWEKKMLENGYDVLVRNKTLKQLKNVTLIDS